MSQNKSGKKKLEKKKHVISSARIMSFCSIFALLLGFYSFVVGRLYINLRTGMFAHTREVMTNTLFISADVDIHTLHETSSPLIFNSDTFSTPYTKLTFNVTSGVFLKQGTFDDYSIKRVAYSKKDKGIVYAVTANNLEDGTNERSIAFVDGYGQSTSKSVTITRVTQNVLGVSDTNEKVWLNGDDVLALVDKNHQLPSNYWPKDLVDLTENNIPITSGQRKLRKIVIKDLKAMFSDAKKEGHHLVVLSAYRSYLKQVTTFDMTARMYGVDQAKNIAALPGHSEHQLGTAFDVTSPDGNWRNATRETNAAVAWLEDHAHEYGFVLSYPKGAEEETGYIYEPWHFRYIGVEHATAVHAEGTALNTYLTGLHFGTNE